MWREEGVGTGEGEVQECKMRDIPCRDWGREEEWKEGLDDLKSKNNSVSCK